MSATLQVANQLCAYTLCEIGTLLSHRSRLDLDILVEGDPALHNPYHAILMNPERIPWLNADRAWALWEHLAAPETQRVNLAGRSSGGRCLFQRGMRKGNRGYFPLHDGPHRNRADSADEGRLL